MRPLAPEECVLGRAGGEGNGARSNGVRPPARSQPAAPSEGLSARLELEVACELLLSWPAPLTLL